MHVQWAIVGERRDERRATLSRLAATDAAISRCEEDRDTTSTKLCVSIAQGTLKRCQNAIYISRRRATYFVSDLDTSGSSSP